jgi:DNA-binding NarL/FixJ family response regulator
MPPPLSPRQQDVLDLLALGKTTREIAQQLCVSVKTVQKHQQNIIDRLNLTGSHRVMRYAMERKWSEVCRLCREERENDVSDLSRKK